MKILVAVDGSPFTKRMLAYLAAHEDWFGGAHDYTVVHAVPPIPARAAAVLRAEVLKTYYDESAEKVLKPIRAYFAKKPELKVRYVFKTGIAEEVIAQVAGKGEYDLIVMGSHGHGTLGNLVMGSVTTKVLANCQVPVLVVR